MKILFGKIGYPLYCDAGPREGAMRTGLAIRLHLSPPEYARYGGPESLHITLGDSGSQPLPAGGTAEPSREPPAGGPRLVAGPQRTPGEPPSDSAASTAREYRDGCR